MLRFTSCLLVCLASPVFAGGGGLSDILTQRMDALALTQGLKGAPELAFPMRQAWQAVPDAEFRPGLVRLYATPEAFVVLAVLEDAFIRNITDAFNQKTWEGGDVFECFIKIGSDRYYEIHVTPENQNLFLRWSPESYRAFRAKTLSFDSALIHERTFALSETQVNAAENYWALTLRIPYTSLGAEHLVAPQAAGTSLPDLRFSFARYDTGAEGTEPVLSATPDLPEANFHLRSHWHPVAWPVR